MGSNLHIYRSVPILKKVEVYSCISAILRDVYIFVPRELIVHILLIIITMILDFRVLHHSVVLFDNEDRTDKLNTLQRKSKEHNRDSN